MDGDGRKRTAEAVQELKDTEDDEVHEANILPLSYVSTKQSVWPI